MEINGLPAHVLIVHAAVVFAPLAATAALIYALVPRWRWATRLLSVGLGAIAMGAITAAYFSGKNFKDRFETNEISLNGRANDSLNTHAERGEILFYVTIVFFLILLAAAWGLGGPSGLKSERGARGRHDPLIEWSLGSLLVVLALMVIAMTTATGDAGASAVWDFWLDAK